MNNAETIIKAIDALSAQISHMQQRAPNVRYELTTLWDKAQAARVATKAMAAELEAIGAGGVEPLRKCAGLVQIQEPAQLAAVQQGVPIGYIHPQNISRLERGEPVAVRKNGWDGEPNQMAVYATHPTQQGLEQPWLQERHLTALKRFQETTDDSQPYDISNNFIKHLLAIGCLQNHGFGKYSITEFGNYVLNSWGGARELPFKSQIERDGEGYAAQAKQGGV